MTAIGVIYPETPGTDIVEDIANIFIYASPNLNRLFKVSSQIEDVAVDLHPDVS
ncbi:MAG: hypothetical protein ACW99Q_28500 [Candidatus Kariarchaeaceae archaeon]|jgi:hypothetical protein